VGGLIKLSFTFDGIPRFVRGAFFRICADGTLRGPEGSLVASYTSKGWLLGARSCREFEAHGPLFLRAHFADGRREHLGPYDSVRAADGALFNRTRCLGVFRTNFAVSPGLPEWNEIAFLERGEERRTLDSSASPTWDPLSPWPPTLGPRTTS
jgi:hypothetical protein